MGVYKLSAAGGVGTARTNYNSFLAGNPKAAAPSYESIATYSITTNTSSITFSSIPSTYAHLQLRLIARTDRASTVDGVLLQFNSDTDNANYKGHFLYGDGSTVGSAAEDEAGLAVYRPSSANAASSIFGAAVTDILDYKSTNKYKTLRYLGGVDFNGSGEVYFGSGLWLSTSAITSITVKPRTGTNFVQYSHFALYGIKGE